MYLNVCCVSLRVCHVYECLLCVSESFLYIREFVVSLSKLLYLCECLVSLKVCCVAEGLLCL